MGAKLAMPVSIHACNYPCKSSTVTASVRGANYPDGSCLAMSGTHVAGQKNSEDAYSMERL